VRKNVWIEIFVIILISTLVIFDDSGKGYCQKFMTQCPDCHLEITKDALAVMKFAKDVVKEGDYNEPSAYLACVLFRLPSRSCPEGFEPVALFTHQ
jgi:hypothetical protein